MADEFEFQAIPKFADLQCEGENLNSTIYFQKISADQDLQSPAHKPATEEAAEVEKEQNHEAYDAATDKENAVNGVRASSKLALFNPAASRVAEKARRRSQQIQAPPEEPVEAPKTARTRTPSSIPKLRSSSFPRKPVVIADVEKLNIEKPVIGVEASSKLALFNPAASRVAEKARRRSQQIQAPPEEPPKEFRSIRTRTPSLIPKLRSCSIPRKPVVIADVEKPKIEKPKTESCKKPEPFTRSLRSYRIPTGKTPMKPLTLPQPFPLRSSSRCRGTVASTVKPSLTSTNPSPIRLPSNHMRDTTKDAAPLSKIRSSSIQRKPVHHPVKPSLTSTNPSPSSQRPSLRGVELNPRLRASVDRLSAPRKRESGRLAK